MTSHGSDGHTNHSNHRNASQASHSNSLSVQKTYQITKGVGTTFSNIDTSRISQDKISLSAIKAAVSEIRGSMYSPNTEVKLGGNNIINTTPVLIKGTEASNLLNSINGTSDRWVPAIYHNHLNSHGNTGAGYASASGCITDRATAVSAGKNASGTINEAAATVNNWNQGGSASSYSRTISSYNVSQTISASAPVQTSSRSTTVSLGTTSTGAKITKSQRDIIVNFLQGKKVIQGPGSVSMNLGSSGSTSYTHQNTNACPVNKCNCHTVRCNSHGTHVCSDTCNDHCLHCGCNTN